MLRPVLEQWFEVLKRYLDSFKKQRDRQWWYNERATLSSLAAAVWIADGIALEEYRTKKGKKSEKWAGRCDLFFRLGTHDFACEAKQVWCSFGSGATKTLEKIKNALSIACKDAGNLDKNEGRRLGICFVIPYLPPSGTRQIIVDQQITRWLEAIMTLDYSLISWVFPKNTRSPVDDSYIYPGVVMLIKEIK